MLERLGWWNVRVLAGTPAVVVGGLWSLEVGKACDVWEKLKDKTHTERNNTALCGLPKNQHLNLNYFILDSQTEMRLTFMSLIKSEWKKSLYIIKMKLSQSEMKLMFSLILIFLPKGENRQQCWKILKYCISKGNKCCAYKCSSY